MVDPTGAVIVYVIAGIAGGFLSSWMAFNASGEKFDIRKHGNALITGALTGMVLGIGLSTATAPEELTQAQFIVNALLTFGTAAGIDRLRSSGSKMTVKALEEKKGKEATTAVLPSPTTTTAPPPPTTVTTTTKTEEVK